MSTPTGDGSPVPPQRPPPTQQRLIAIGVVGMVAMLIVAGVAILAVPYALDRARPGVASERPGSAQEVVVVVANGVYAPNVIRARAGAPLRLRLEIRERHACATKLLVPDLHLAFDLPSMGEVVLEIPPTVRGTYLFTCGQKMVKGSLIFE